MRPHRWYGHRWIGPRSRAASDGLSPQSKGPRDASQPPTCFDDRRAAATCIVAAIAIGWFGASASTASAAICSAATTVTDEATLNGAIVCYNDQTPAGDHVITFGSDISVVSGATDITQAVAANALTIDGAGFTLTAAPGVAQGAIDVKGAGEVVVENLTIAMPLAGAEARGVQLWTAAGEVAVRNSTIADGENGVYTFGGSVTVADSTITDSSRAAVEVTTGGEAFVSNSVLKDSFAGLLTFGGEASISASELSGNTNGIQMQSTLR